MRRSRSKLPSLFAGVVFIVSAFGCDSKYRSDSLDLNQPLASSQMSLHQTVLQAQELTASPMDRETSEAGKERHDALSPESNGASRKLTSQTAEWPSPGRINAFEFNAATAFAGLDQIATNRQLRVIGFVDAGQPSVMLVIDGKTHVLSASQSFDHVTVQSIDPPVVQVTNHGANQTLSLFDSQQPQGSPRREPK